MLISSKIIKRKAVETMTEIRQRGISEIRKLQLPNFILSAEQYHKLINWNLSQVTEPPILSNFSSCELEQIHKNKMFWSSNAVQ